MQSIFSNALSRAIAKHIDLSVTRRETLSWLTLLIMQHGTICLWRLAAYVVSVAQTDSVRRRFYRFFQFVRLDGTLAAHVVVELLGLGGKPWVLAIDRTNWDFGKTTINILMISVTWNGMGIPLLWMLLPTAGNSHTSERTELLDRLRAAFPGVVIVVRGVMENRIKEEQLDLFGARASCHSFRGNEIRLWLPAASHLLIVGLRRLGLSGTELARAQASTLRVKLLKIGAQVVVSVRRVYIQLSTANPLKELFAVVAERLRSPPIAASD